MLTEREFTAAAEQYLDMAYRLALNACGSAADAEDAVQNAMLRLWRTDTAFESGEHLRRWIIRVTSNECRRITGHPWRRRSVPLESCPEPVLEDREKRALWEAVAALPEKYRVPLYLYYYEGYAVDEVGELRDLKPSTVQTRLARARERVKTLLWED